MPTTYVAQIEIQGIDYNNAEHGIVVKGLVKIDALRYISSFEAHPKTKHLSLAKVINNEELEIPKEVHLKPKIKEAIFGQIGKINMPFIKRIPLE